MASFLRWTKQRGKSKKKKKEISQGIICLYKYIYKYKLDTHTCQTQHHIYTYIQRYIHTYTHTYIRIHTNIQTYIHKYIRINTVYIHAYIYNITEKCKEKTSLSKTCT